MLMRSFMFKKALMQEHFNENYVESYKYPKATFSGKILNFVELSEENNVTEIIGTLTVHGEEKEISTKVIVEIAEDGILLKGVFMWMSPTSRSRFPRLSRTTSPKPLR